MSDETESHPPAQHFQWLGRDAPHLDAPAIARCGDVVIGCYGGRQDAGADKNEDGALVWCAADRSWEFAVLLDAHASSDSAALVLTTVANQQGVIAELLAQPISTAFRALEQHLIDIFGSARFRAACRELRGETAMLICARKEQFLWWFCVGDCVAYLLHPDLAAFGQFALNQRSFFEWVGRISTFDLPVPCYASGVRELRGGVNVICLTTDGLLEYKDSPFADPRGFFDWFTPASVMDSAELVSRVMSALSHVHESNGRDSATLIAWSFDNRRLGHSHHEFDG